MEVIKIKDLPLLERPREKAMRFGINKLTNLELLALIIGSGGKGNNVLMVASTLLAKASSIDHLFSFTYYDYLLIPGINEAVAMRFLAINELIKRQGEEEKIYSDSSKIADRYRYLIGNNKYESMHLIGISSSWKILLEKELYKGTRHKMVSSEIEIINELKIAKAKYFVLVHNHPSGNAKPSEDDIISTNHLKIYAKREGFIMLDHLVVSKNATFSFKNESLNI